MEIFDFHCDVLEKISQYENVNFRNDPRLQANLERLKMGNVKVQVFAIFIHPRIPKEHKFAEALRQIEAFHTKVLSEPEMVHITDWKQIDELNDGQIGAVLSLEGCDAIGDDINKLTALLDAGVKIVGLTWNYENEVAYGASEEPSKGIKLFGRKVISLLNERNIIIDIAHLNEQGFYDVLPIAKHIIASHCNARTLCNHPRNLKDEQIKDLVNLGGRIHIVFYPPFIEDGKVSTTIDKLVQHVEYIARLVGVENIGFGSDFDGIDPHFVKQLGNASNFQNLVQSLLKKFSIEDVKQIASQGFKQYVKNMEKRRKL